MTKIFVAKLDFNVSNDQLKSLFENYGEVVKATVAIDKETGKSRGFAFVEMANAESCAKAIEELDGHALNGRNIAVKIAEDRSKDKRPQNNQNSRDFKPRQNFDQRPKFEKPNFTSPSEPEELPFPKNNRKKSVKERERTETDKDGGSKKTKMNAYKKSNKFKFDFDDDDDIEGGLFAFNNDEE